MPVLQLNTVRDTTLWQMLDNGFSGADGETARTLAVNLVTICQEAYDRMRGFPSLHPEYTLHDQVHSLRVAELMYKVMPQPVVSLLNPVEIALLILSAHFHDQGMVLERAEVQSLEQNSEFRVFRDNWVVDHPNLQATREMLKDRSANEESRQSYRETEHELEGALLTDYVRTTHGQRSADFVRSRYGGDPRWLVSGTNLAEFVARLSLSHVKPALNLTPAHGFRFDETIGTYKTNMVYLGLILRLADILDFDRDRTPDSLYRTIDFRSKVSLKEWEKHRAVDGWVIEPTKVQFTMRCEHPEYQRAAYQFMDWIDVELADAHAISSTFPASFSNYKLDLPLSVDRSRIEPKDQSYVYYDLEFSLSRDEIIKLLMTENLYGSASLCIRELLQNSLDALRLRRARMKRDTGVMWELGKVEIEHALDQRGYEIIKCTDNGVGMNEEIITRFLIKAGRSYYRSPKFNQERIDLRAAGVDFDPCAQFGIGFMSCFMLGDRITIMTRRDNGPLIGQGEPLVVEINGLNSMIVIRKGTTDQPVGTTVVITGRKHPRGFEWWQDEVNLIEVLNGYALATEFPIEGRCNIPEINKSTLISPQIACPLTEMERAGVKSIVTFKQLFADVDSLFGGELRASFLIDETGLLTLNNNEAGWKINSDGRGREARLMLANGTQIDYYGFREGQVCIDGILIAGDPGRDDKEEPHYLPRYASPISLGSSSFVLDIRGQIKPPLTPARTVPDSVRDLISDKNVRWSYVRRLALRAEGRLWEQIAQQLSNGLADEIFWQSAIIHSIHELNLDWMRAGTIWSLISIPTIDESDTVKWRKVSDLGVLTLRGNSSDDFELHDADGRFINMYQTLTDWQSEQDKERLATSLRAFVVRMSTLLLRNEQVCLELRHPADVNSVPAENSMSSATVLSYDSSLSDFLSVHSCLRTVNKTHPLTQLALNARYCETKSSLERFAIKAVGCLSSPEVLETNSAATELKSNDPNRLKRWRRSVGFSYEDVEWNGISEELRPPYRIRAMGGEIIEIDHEHFQSWASETLGVD